MTHRRTETIGWGRCGSNSAPTLWLAPVPLTEAAPAQGFTTVCDETRRLTVSKTTVEGCGDVFSGKVHGPQCVVVDLNGLGQRLGVPAVALP